HSNIVLDFVNTTGPPGPNNTTDETAAPFPVPGTSLSLNIDGDQGALLQAEADLNLDLFGFISGNGHFAFKKATANFLVTDGHTTTSLTNAGYVAIGGHINSAFAGVGSFGLTLTNIDFGILLV